VPAAPLTAAGIEKTGPSGLPNQTSRFPQLQAGASGFYSFRVANTFFTPLGNRSCPTMARYVMEIYNNNIIMPSIYTNPEV
jgi:hypothetical protein